MLIDIQTMDFQKYQFDKSKKLGQGAFSEVYLIKVPPNQKSYALKIVN